MAGLMDALVWAKKSQDLYLEGGSFEDDGVAEGIDLAFFEFHGVEFTRCVFTGALLRKASFYDCILRECDLTGVDLTSCFFARTRLLACKLEGAVLTGAILRSTRLVGCQCRYLNAGEVRFEGVLLKDCDLSEAFLSEVRFVRSTRLEGCKLVHADLFRTPLAGVDLTTCDIVGILTSEDRHEMRGALISLEQAPEVAIMLGVRIEGYE